MKDNAQTVGFVDEDFAPDGYRALTCLIVSNNVVYVETAFVYKNKDINVITRLNTGEYIIFIFGSYFV